jgi:phosphate starvation-inducible protein PhoH and related proteins
LNPRFATGSTTQKLELPDAGPDSGPESGPESGEAESLILAFDDNRLLTALFGEHDEHLALIESRLNVHITPRGNRLALKGAPTARDSARAVLMTLYDKARRGIDITSGEVEGAIRMSAEPIVPSQQGPGIYVRTQRKIITPRSPGQKRYMEAIRKSELVFGTGPAGTGKTYLAVACAAAALAEGSVDRIILSRPAVEAGERLGFLPGDMKEKVDPYLRPLYDALYDVMPGNVVARGLADQTIEIAPLAFMRGRTLASAFIILDEAQNTTSQQMKMFLTRLGEGGRMVVNGDPTQVDLPPGTTSGLSNALDLLGGVEGIDHVAFTAADIVRHPLVTRIVNAYEAASAAAQRSGTS